MTKYAIVRTKDAAKKAIDQSGLKEQKELFVSVMKHEMTRMMEKMTNMMAKARSKPTVEGWWWVILGLRISVCNEYRVAQDAAAVS